jgi:SAM-dependent methyltransferase
MKPGAIERHNRTQHDYFEHTLKATMVPRATPYVERHVDELVACVGMTPADRVLEVGCGMGRYTLPLVARGYQVSGMDLTQALLDRLREYGGGLDVPLYCADVLNPPGELLGRFDVVCGLFTLHHLHDVPSCMGAMRRLLRPGGRIAFLEPNAWNPLYYVQIAVTPRMTWQGDKGVARMRKSVVLPAMREAGFTDLTVRRFGLFPPFVTNRSWGRALEGLLERFPPWRPFLPFQLFAGRRPPRR